MVQNVMVEQSQLWLEGQAGKTTFHVEGGAGKRQAAQVVVTERGSCVWTRALKVIEMSDRLQLPQSGRNSHFPPTVSTTTSLTAVTSPSTAAGAPTTSHVTGTMLQRLLARQVEAKRSRERNDRVVGAKAVTGQERAAGATAAAALWAVVMMVWHGKGEAAAAKSVGVAQLATDSGYIDAALMELYHDGLHESIQDMLSQSLHIPETLEDRSAVPEEVLHRIGGSSILKPKKPHRFANPYAAALLSQGSSGVNTWLLACIAEACPLASELLVPWALVTTGRVNRPDGVDVGPSDCAALLRIVARMENMQAFELVQTSRHLLDGEAGAEAELDVLRSADIPSHTARVLQGLRSLRLNGAPWFGTPLLLSLERTDADLANAQNESRRLSEGGAGLYLVHIRARRIQDRTSWFAEESTARRVAVEDGIDDAWTRDRVDEFVAAVRPHALPVWWRGGRSFLRLAGNNNGERRRPFRSRALFPSPPTLRHADVTDVTTHHPSLALALSACPRLELVLLFGGGDLRGRRRLRPTPQPNPLLREETAEALLTRCPRLREDCDDGKAYAAEAGEEEGGRGCGGETKRAAPADEVKGQGSVLKDPAFWEEFRSYYPFMGRLSPLHLAEAAAGGARTWLKREDFSQTGSQKINNALGHFGLDCAIYMGAEEVRRQALNVVRIKLLGAKVVPVCERVYDA
ncbi:hypothetical protein DFJ73DRAFT_905125 [Zopfochytrium polystomum]|nr:hypothetical protein DFJ73DRAFT_905125 [Zopfochytrium polystomum]